MAEHEADARRYKLGRYTGERADTKFVYGLARSFGDLAAWERGRLRMLVYLARYLRQPIADLERRPLDELRVWAELTSEIVKQENGTTPSLTGRAEETSR